MDTSIVLIALIGTLQYRSAISAAINYEPIKITVNENFNAQPGQVFPQLQGRQPGIYHQGANFYFKPQLNLPQSYVPSHIEALMSLMHQHHHSSGEETSKVVFEKDKLIEIIKPFMYPSSDISKETLSKIAIEKENNLEFVKPIIITEEPKRTPELLVILEAPGHRSTSINGGISSFVEELKKEESIILEEPMGVFPKTPEIAVIPIKNSIVNYVEPKPITSELVVVSEAPVLTFNANPTIVEAEVQKEESIIQEESTHVFPRIPEIAVGSVTESIINYVEPKAVTSEFVVIPEVPVLPVLAINDIHVVEEEVKIEEPIVVDVEPKPAIQELVTISEATVLPSLSLHDTSSSVTESIINYVEPKAVTSELVVIPEVPVLPVLAINDIHVVEGEVKIEEPIVVDVEPKPAVQELVTISEATVLPSLSLHDTSSSVTESIINYVEPKAVTSELVVIPEVPVLPVLAVNDIHVVEEVKIDEPIVVDVEPKPAIQELVTISEATVLPSFSLHDTSSSVTESIINYVEPKPITSELVVISEAPVPSLNSIPTIVEEVQKEESIILKESTNVFPKITEIAVEQPVTELIINYVEPKPVTSELVVISEEQVLPPLTFNDIPPIIKEVKKEESIILEEPVILEESTDVFTTIPEIAVGPITELNNNYVEPKPMTSELVVIPEAPVLPPITLNEFPFMVEQEVKKEESIILEKPTGVFPTISEIAVRPITEPIINYVNSKPINAEFVFIPEAPVLPPFSANNNHMVEEEGDIEEPIIVDVEPELITSELVIIPEAPILSPLSYNGISPVVEEVKIEKSINVEESTGVFSPTLEISARPFPEPLGVSGSAESFVLENHIFPVAKEEVKIEIPILLEESITLQESSPEITNSYVLEDVSQPKPEIDVTFKEKLRPKIISKPSNHLGVYNYVPFVSHLSNRAPKTKKLMNPKPAFLERFLHKEHPFRLPVMPFPNLDLNAVKSFKWGNNKQFLYPTSFAHDVVKKRIAPSMAFKKQNAPKWEKIYIRPNVSKGPSYF